MSYNNLPYLHVYKASAGSGKTHQLTGQYIRLLFLSPYNYRHILAVTFTNKATDEMKSRIIEELNNLASGRKSDYLSDLKNEYKLSEATIRERARGILRDILHNYSSFSISTIDRFFLQTMHSFTREMGLAGGYRIEVDNQSFLPEIVDLMLNELDEEGNEELIKWLLDYMRDRIEENNSWQINQDVLKLASNLFDERFIALSAPVQDQIKDKERLAQYKQKLLKIIATYKQQLKEIGGRAQDIFKKYNLEFSDFKGGSRSQFNRFDSWARGEIPSITSTFMKFPDNVTFWYTKAAPANIKSAIEGAYYDGLNDCVKEAIDLYENDTDYVTACEILKLFNTLGILSDVNDRLQKYRQDTNILFLSDTTELLNKIIADSESPFVYEKIGTRLNHFMIDEFQDTSAMQWNNFRPLLQEAIASGRYNMIVGDVKQSIYRWRNTDWRLLEEQLEKDFLSENIAEHVLETNWRSDANIIRFNNQLFSQAASVLQQEFNSSDDEILSSDYYSSRIETAYAQIAQQVAPHNQKDEGYININFVDTEEVDSWQEEVLNQLPLTIEQLQEEGYRLKDIAILVRTRKEATAVTEALLEYKDKNPQSPYKFDFISNEGLLLCHSSCVKTVVALLQYLNSPYEKTIRVRALYEYYSFITTQTPSLVFENYLQNEIDEIPSTLQENLDAIAFLPLYEQAEALFGLIKEYTLPTDVAYIQAFLDLINDYSARHASDLNGFLSWWKEVKDKKSLFTPDDHDAIQVMTIHKSKGLQFGVVIVPFANWDFPPRSSGNILWCKPNKAPFDDIGVVPVNYTNRLASTIFKNEYLQEKLYSFIDNLNLLYVTFTRTKHQLLVWAPAPKSKEPKENEAKSIKTVSDLLWRVVSSSSMQENADAIDFANYYDNDKLMFSFGNVAERVNRLVLSTEKPGAEIKWESIPFQNRLDLRLEGIGYFSDDGSRDYGNLMHDIVSEMHTMDDLDIALDKKVLSGDLPTKERQKIYQLLTESLALPEVQEWYSGKYNVLNEQQVLHPSLHFIRPDRVMIKNDSVVVIDYKFGELIEKRYERQVQRYMHVIRNMGYTDVKGYLFYVTLKKVVPIE